MEAGADFGLRNCGMYAMDTLRQEKGALPGCDATAGCFVWLATFL
jgi:glycine cleavage system aminomethyltransferase T